MKETYLTWSGLVEQTLAIAREQNFDNQWVLNQIAAHGHPPWGIWRKLGLALGKDINWVNESWQPSLESQFPNLDEFFANQIPKKT